MPFNDVAVDQGRVTRAGAIRHAEVGFERSQLGIFTEIDVGSKILQVPDPLSAAPSAGFLVHLEGDARQVEPGSHRNGRGGSGRGR